MKRFARQALTFVATILLFSVTAPVFADSHEEVADAAITQMERMVAALATVTDKPTAEKAVTQLMDVAAELKKVAARAKAVGQPTPEVKAKIEAKMKERQTEIMKKMPEVQANLQKAGPEAAQVIQKGMIEFSTAMQEVGKAFKDADAK
jgi:hypothetical protein